MLIVLLFLHENICCGYLLEAPRGGASNEYPQHVFVEKQEKYLSGVPTDKELCFDGCQCKVQFSVIL